MGEVHPMKRILKIIALGLCLGLGLVLIQQGLNIDEHTFLMWYWVLVPALLVVVVLINVLYNLFYLHKVKALAAQLEEGNPQAFVAGLENLLHTAKGRRLREILTLNLAAGYVETKQFDTAIPMLEAMAHQRLRNTTLRVTHTINLCLSYFETNQYEKALELYQTQQPLLDTFRHDSTYGIHIAILDVVAALAQGDYAQAETLLHTAAQTKTTPRMQRALDELSHTVETVKAQQGS